MASFDRTILKSAMLRDKGFLKDLYSGNSVFNLKKLQNANDHELSTLIKILYYITNGEIKIKKDHFNKLTEANKIKSLRKVFESKGHVIALLKGQRIDKLKILKQLATVFPILLYPLFNE